VRARLLLGDKIVHRYAFSYPSFAGLLPVRNFRELRTSSREETLAQTLKPLYLRVVFIHYCDDAECYSTALRAAQSAAPQRDLDDHPAALRNVAPAAK